jgi:hypothetical protein
MAALIGVSVKPGAGGGDDSYVCTVPLDLLSEDGVPPAEGDKVSYSVDGTVQSVDGNNANVEIDAVNGQPVEGSAAEEAGESPEEEASEDQGTGANKPPVAAGGKKAMGPIPPVTGIPPVNKAATALMGKNLRKKAAANSLGMF